MAAMDHRPIGDGRFTECIHCCETWPCPTADMRRELADFLRRSRVSAHETDGVGKAAELIDIE